MSQTKPDPWIPDTPTSKTSVEVDIAILDSLREMFIACAVACRVILRHGLIDEFTADAERAGVRSGFGGRALDRWTRAGPDRRWVEAHREGRRAMKLKRIQLSRKKGRRLPRGYISVAPPSALANPYPGDRAAAVFGEWLRSGIENRPCAVGIDAYDAGIGYPVKRKVVAAFVRLEHRVRRGEVKGLACWCPLPKRGQPDRCHAAAITKVLKERMRR